MPEHLWGKKLNRLKAIWHAQTEEYIFVLCFLIREYINHENKQIKSKKQGYWDEPIENFNIIRLHKKKEEININHLYVPTIDCLRCVNHKQLPYIKRKSFVGKIKNCYINVFFKEGDIGWIEHPFIELERELLNIYKQNLIEKKSKDIIADILLDYAYKKCDYQWVILEPPEFKHLHKPYIMEFMHYNQPIAPVKPFTFNFDYWIAPGSGYFVEQKKKTKKKK